MDTLKDIISEYLGIPQNEIDINMSLSNEIGLDSFGLISLINAIETTFSVSIPEYELNTFQTLNDLAGYIEHNSASF